MSQPANADRELASDLKRAAKAFNEQLGRAAAAGLQVGIEAIELRIPGGGVSTITAINVDVARPL